MAKKAPKKNNAVEAYKHKKETRKNAVPVGLASYDASKPKPKKYEYDWRLARQSLLTDLCGGLCGRMIGRGRSCSRRAHEKK